MTTTLAEKTKELARKLTVTSVNPKAFVSDVYAALVASGDVADGELANYKSWLVAMHRRGLVTLSRCDMAPAFDQVKLAASETRCWGAEFHFIRG